MSEHENNGIQEATVPETAPVLSEADKKFYELNPHLGKSDAQKTEEKPSDGVKEDESKQESAKPENGQTEKHGKSGWERRVGSLTKQNKELKTRLEALEKQYKKPSETTEPKKFSRDAFKSDEEYWNHLAEQKANEIVERKLAEREKHTNESLEEIQARTLFEKEWYQKAKQTFGSDEATKQYMELVKESHETGLAESIPQDVYAFLEASKVGTMMHSILLAKEDIRDEILSTPENIRPFALYDLQKRVMAHMQNKGQEQKKVTQAPDPVGNPSVSGSAVDETKLPWSEQLKRYKEQNKRF